MERVVISLILKKKKKKRRISNFKMYWLGLSQNGCRNVTKINEHKMPTLLTGAGGKIKNKKPHSIGERRSLSMTTEGQLLS